MSDPGEIEPPIGVDLGVIPSPAPGVTEVPAESVGLGRRAASGAMWISIETAVTQAMSLVVFTVMARFLSAAAFGLVSLTFVLLLSVKIVVLDQIATAVVRKPTAEPREYSTAFWISVAFGIVAFLGFNAFSLIAWRVFDAPGLGTIIRAMSVLLLAISVTRTQEQWLSRHFRFRVLATRSIAGAIVGAVAGIGSVVAGLGVWALVVQQLVQSLTGMSMLWSTCPWRPRFEFDRRAAREIVDYMRGILGALVMYVLNQNCDVVLVGLFFGPSSVGIYGIGKRLTVALHMVAAAPISGVAMPSLAEVQEDEARLRQLLLTATLIALSTCAPVFLGAAAVDEDVIRLAFGPRWAGSVPVFGWLAIGTLFLVLLDYNNNVFAIRNRPGWTTAIAVGYSVMALGFFFLFHWLHFGSIAMPFILPYVVIFPISLALLMRITGLGFGAWIGAVVPPLASAMVMFLGVRGLIQVWSAAPALRLPASIALGVALYGTCMAILAREASGRVLSILSGRLRGRPAAAIAAAD